MSLSNAPGVWRWEQRGDKWWRIHDALNIEDGPHSAKFDPLPPPSDVDGPADLAVIIRFKPTTNKISTREASMAIEDFIKTVGKHYDIEVSEVEFVKLWRSGITAGPETNGTITLVMR
jgi:hypothetical protein